MTVQTKFYQFHLPNSPKYWSFWREFKTHSVVIYTLIKFLNQQNNFMLDGANEAQYSNAVGSVQQRKRRLIMHDNLTNSRGTNRIHNNSVKIQAQQQDYELMAILNSAPGQATNKTQVGIGL